MQFTDMAVRGKGKTYRFISNETQAAIFDKAGAMTKVTRTTEDNARVFEVTDESGNVFALTRTAKPCSCIGGVWRSRPSELVSQL